MILDPSQWDDFTMRTVWKFGGYRMRACRFPGRIRALFHMLIRSLLWTGTGPHAVSLTVLPGGSVPIAITRSTRMSRAVPFRAAVHCTAPPPLLIYPEGRTTP